MGRLLRDTQTSYARGELNLKMLSRFDTEHYKQGAEKMRNVQVLPHGGFIQRPGLVFVEEALKQLSRVTGQTITCPNGGTTANANDDDTTTEVTTTTNVSTTDPYVIVHYDLGSAMTIRFADVRGLRLDSAGVTLSGEVRVQYSTDDAAWNDFGSAFDTVADTDVNRRRSSSGAAVSARYWRVVRVGTTDADTRKFVLDEFNLWTESATLSACRDIAFAASTAARYMLKLTDRNIRVFLDRAWVADIRVPHTSAQLATVNWVQSLDTLLLFHADVQTHEVMRQGADDEWEEHPLVFSNIPNHDFGAGAEAVWSDARGWPKAGTFHEGRSYMGGSSQAPNVWCASTVTDLFDFDDSSEADDKGWKWVIESDQVEDIYNIRSGRHLQIFTESGEFYVLPDDQPITVSTCVVKRTSELGSEGPGLRTVSVEGATLFVQHEGGALREFLYADAEQAYSSQDISLLSSHLLRTPVDLAIRRATSTEQGDLVLVVNDDDGTLAVLTTLRTQKITGWCLWQTDGLFLSAGVDRQDMWVCVERTVNGQTVRYHEVFDYAYQMDCAIKYTAGLPTDTFAVAHLEAETLGVYADDAVLADVTVSGGSVTIARDAETEVELGLPWPDQTGDGDWLHVQDMPYEPGLPEGTSIGRKMRVHAVVIRCQNTQTLRIGANGKATRPLSFRSFGSALLDQPPEKFTGDKKLKGIKGFSDRGQVEITKREPGPVQIDSMTKWVSL